MAPWTLVARAWTAAQVELHGQYSVERLHRVRAYCRRESAAHSTLVLLLTPLPCLLVVLAIECIPLENPRLGIEHALPFLVRAFLFTLIVDFLVLHQCRYLIPTLPTSVKLVLASSCVAAAGAVLSVYCVANVVGFPLPFTVLVGSPVSSALLAACAYGMWGRFFRNRRDERKALFGYILVVAVQVAMTYVYPAYAFAFVQLSGVQQLAFALLLPLMKLVAKNWISHLFRNNHDLKSDMVVLNADVYHALFVSWCMNDTASTFSTVFLMVMDLAEGILAIKDVNGMLQNLFPLVESIDSPQTNTAIKSPRCSIGRGPYSNVSLLDLAVAIWRIDKLKGNPCARNQSHLRSPTEWCPSSVMVDNANRASYTPSALAPQPLLSLATVAPAPSVATIQKSTHQESYTSSEIPGPLATQAAASMSMSDRSQCLQLVLRLLHLSEFLLLIEFIEVMIPSVYCVYLLGIYYLPNRKYFDTIGRLSAEELHEDIANVALYALLELSSLVLMCLILQRKLGISPVKQLAFVLESQWQLAQSKLVLWVVYSVQWRLDHFGADFSFQFKWLSVSSAATTN